jgi:predicted NBD/HSP70 family sugar kinase
MLSILNAVRENGPVSRIEVGKLLGLSSTTSMTLTKELIAKNLIHENGLGNSSGGRKPVLLEINWDYRHVIGVVLSAAEVFCAVYNLQLSEVAVLRRSVNMAVNMAEKDLVSVIRDSVRKILKKSGLAENDIGGMTLGVSGLVDPTSRNLVSSSHFHSREIIHVLDKMESVFPFPVYLENYSNLAALAENKLFYPNAKSLAAILVDEGMGSGIIRDCAIVRGAYGYAGDIGHISIDPAGPQCFCGNRGCLEVMGGITALLKKCEKRLLEGEKSVLEGCGASGSLTIETLAEAFHQGDNLARELFEEEADILYQAINNIILTHDPEVIVLVGDITLFGQAMIDRIKSKIQRTIYWLPAKERTIALAKLKKNPRLSGAGMHAIDSFFLNYFA